ncbi:probable beta-glucosidase L [Aspergillus lentulus]|uniref:beta-glucosidase n=1 Tax=Aspergillus lentulus TaxID=293939 RepID=UPI0013942978|nr:probable beta-glucosidase L [Aspergillus lentulus]GFF44633.1 probable beta-glucosidase L [Aspergillus lentulus]GFF68910.1 probable beta-glucosidase L [Aspergillus lentulus]GFG14176.1 probable beta-glucosidase L [Aspergillus lentulus]
MQNLFLSLLAAAVTVHAYGSGGSNWDQAYSRAKDALQKLNQTEKVGLVTGVKWMGGPCVGNTYKPQSIDYPSLCLQDSPLGIRFANPVTAFPAGINAGATWDTQLLYARGAAMGAEAKGLGVHVQLGPVAGPLGKNPNGGRNWEGFSVDPYLSGIAMEKTIRGMQDSGVQACAKHWLGNEQEHYRDTISSNIGDRAAHELYVWPFMNAVKADVASVMCSYNKVNGTWACESDELNNKLMKEELGFPGYIMSDWNAQHSTVNSAVSGLDMTMPGSDFSSPPGSIFWGSNLEAAVADGSVPQSRLDDMVTRILAAWYLVGQDRGYPPTAFSSWNGGKANVDVTADHATVARAVARDSIVLLKNDQRALPLRKPKSLAIVGLDAIVNPAGPNACSDRGCNNGTLAMGWGSGTAEFPYLVGPLDAIQKRATADGTKIVPSTTNDPTAGASAAAAAETAIVFINSDSGEGYITVEGNQGDRNNLDPWHNGNELVKAVAAASKNVIVVVHSVGPIILETILAQPSVKAIVWAGLPGQESGNALVDVIYGDTAPSGKLPYTIAKQAADYGASWINAETDDFTEGLYIDYRHFDANGIAPRYEFGYGLSYTNFKYSGLWVNVYTSAGAANGKVVPGGPADLFEVVGQVSVFVRNNGRVAGAEVAQLYIGLPDSAPATPPKQLRGFQKMMLQPGQMGRATFELTRRDLSYWDVQQQKWVVPSGTFKVYVGSSSRDIREEGSFRVRRGW